MDFADIARRALAARQIVRQFGAVSITLTVPTKHEGELLYATSASGGEFDTTARLRFIRAALCKSVTSWAGVKVSDILSDARDGEREQPVEFAADAVPLLLDANPEWEDDLSHALMEATAKRRAAEEATAKN